MSEKYLGIDDRCRDDYAERLTKLEVAMESGFESIGRTLDDIKEAMKEQRDDFKAHDKIEAAFRNNITNEQASINGKITGSKWMLAVVSGIAGVAMYLGIKTP